jgi:hypothetical protein
MVAAPRGESTSLDEEKRHLNSRGLVYRKNDRQWLPWVNLMATQKSKTPEPTRAGYVPGAFSALVGFFSAVPVVMWTVHDNVLSKASSILIVFMIILGFFLVGAGVLRLFGIRILKQPDDSTS